MASPLLRKAGKELEKKDASLARARKKAKEEKQAAYLEGGAGVLAGSVGAGFVDAKMGDGAGPAEIGETGIPLNAVVGGVIGVAAAFMPKLPGRYFLGFGGLSAAGTSLYDMTRDKFSE